MGFIFEQIWCQLPVKCSLCLFCIFTSEQGYDKWALAHSYLVLFWFNWTGNILWNYLISWGPNFVDCGCFAYSLGCNFSRKTIYLIISFRRGCKFVVKGTHEYHENWDSANSNDPRVIFWKSYFILVLSAFNGYKSFDRSRNS